VLLKVRQNRRIVSPGEKKMEVGAYSVSRRDSIRFCSMLSRSYALSSPHSSAEETAGNSLSADSLKRMGSIELMEIFDSARNRGQARHHHVALANIDFHEDDLFYSLPDDDFLRFQSSLCLPAKNFSRLQLAYLF
jgi:hypothetical protein